MHIRPWIKKFQHPAALKSESASRVGLFAIQWTTDRQARLSMEFPRQGYWNE